MPASSAPITIVGCGALGALMAARLLAAGHGVQVLQRAGPQLRALRASGVTLHDREEQVARYVPDLVTDQPGKLAATHLIIVLVKAGDTGSVADLAPSLLPDGVVLSLQNGMGNGEALAAIFGADRVALGVGTYGAHRSAPGVVHWGGDGYLKLGPMAGPMDARVAPTHGSEAWRFAWVAELLTKAGFAVSYLPDPQPAIWTKLIHNLMINTVSALTRSRNGEIKDDFGCVQLMRRLGEEGVAVARQAGVELDFDEVWRLHRETLTRTANNRTSMLQDIEAGRPTEVDAIAGPLLALCPNERELPHTRTVYGLIKALEATTES